MQKAYFGCIIRTCQVCKLAVRCILGGHISHHIVAGD